MLGCQMDVDVWVSWKDVAPTASPQVITTHWDASLLIFKIYETLSAVRKLMTS